MISILIPVYNYDVKTLVFSLSEQLTSLNIQGEIIVLDDASDINFRNINCSISGTNGVYYKYLENNLGRLRVRQKLASMSSFNWLLFIDADSKIISDQFLQNYLKAINDSSNVISGGRIYEKDKPTDCSRVLHWKYGSERENIHKRTTSFMTNNFVIRKEVFEKINFPKDWSNYGHEDTAIGIALDQLDIKQVRIHNPVLHEKLETTDSFILKSEQALQNISLLVDQYGSDTVSKYIKVYKWANRIKNAGMKKIMEVCYSYMQDKILRNLNSCNPSLFYFDLYRLIYLLEF